MELTRRWNAWVRRATLAVAIAVAVVLAGGALLVGPGAGAAVADPLAQQAPRGNVRVVVIGDSFTSGEGASARSYRTVDVPTVDEFGNPSSIRMVDPAHQSSTAPAMQAIERLRAENPDVSFDVSFVPVSGATRDSLYQPTRPGTPFEQPAQIEQIRGADVVVLGIGGNDARFADWARTVVYSREATSEREFPNFLGPVQDPAFAQAQAKVYNDVRSQMNPEGQLLVTGYPMVLPDTVPPGTSSWLSYQVISSREAQLSNQLGAAINQQVQRGVELAGETQGPAVRFLDMASTLDNNRLFSAQEGVNGIRADDSVASYHPNDLGQRLLGEALRPHLDQAVRDTLTRQGVLPPADQQQQGEQQQPAPPPGDVPQGGDQQQELAPPPGDVQQGDQQQPADQQPGSQQGEQPAPPPGDVPQGGEQPQGDQQQELAPPPGDVPPGDQQPTDQPPADQLPADQQGEQLAPPPGDVPQGGEQPQGDQQQELAPPPGDVPGSGGYTDGFTGGGGDFGGGGATGDYSSTGSQQSATADLAGDLAGGSGVTNDFSGDYTGAYADSGTADYSGGYSDFSGGTDFSSGGDFSGGGEFGGGGDFGGGF